MNHHVTILGVVQQVLQGGIIDCKDQRAGRAADVYACGVHLYKMLFLQYPFDGDSVETMSTNIISGNLIMPRQDDAEVVNLLEHMLLWDWEQRITISEIKEHPVYLTNLPLEIEVCGYLGLCTVLCCTFLKAQTHLCCKSLAYLGTANASSDARLASHVFSYR
jgi:serine/threonine protein kinase